MRLRRPPARRRPETIVALIDVVFFLLAFFMLIGRMDATAPFAVDPAVAATGADMAAGGTTVAVGADGALALDGAAVTMTALREGLAAALAEDPAAPVRLNAHGEAALRHLLPLAAAAEEMGARDVLLVVTPRPAP